MKDPDNPLSGSPPPPPAKDPIEEWRNFEGSQYLHHLTDQNFDTFVKDKKVLVMFYAPCKYAYIYVWYHSYLLFIKLQGVVIAKQ